MKKTQKIILFIIIISILLLGIGYAAIQNVTLNIVGTAEADSSQSNFAVRFSSQTIPTVSDSTYATARVTNDSNAVLNVNGLTSKGQTIEATYTIENNSSDLSSDLTISTTNSNTEYFKISSKLAKTSLVANESTTVTIIVEVIKTPIESVSSTIGVQMIAMPVQPGEEGSSIPPMSQLTLSSLTNDNIGDYVDLGNSYVGTNETTDDWRVFYKDDTYVYVILNGYLQSKFLPEEVGLSTATNFPYCVKSTVNREDYLNRLNNSTAWKIFANGIPNAYVKGTPTLELFLASYNYKNNSNFNVDLDITDFPQLDTSIEEFDLYIPEIPDNYSGAGYVLATPYESIEASLYFVAIDNTICMYPYLDTRNTIRPIIAIPLETPIAKQNNIWTIF